MIQIRPATPADAQAIAEIHVASWQAAYSGLLPEEFLQNLSVDGRLQIWQHILRTGSTETWVAEEVATTTQLAGAVIGFVNFGPGRDEDVTPQTTGEILAIYLLPSAWGQGAGAQLCRQALTRLRQQGFTEVTLWVLHNNTRAIRFYELAGFQADGAAKTERWSDVVLEERRYRQVL